MPVDFMDFARVAKCMPRVTSIFFTSDFSFIIFDVMLLPADQKVHSYQNQSSVSVIT